MDRLWVCKRQWCQSQWCKRSIGRCRSSPADEWRSLWSTSFRWSGQFCDFSYRQKICSKTYWNRRSKWRLVASTTFFCHRSEGGARFDKGTWSGRIYRYGSSWNQLYGSGRAGCYSGCYLFYRDVWCDYGTCLHSHVFTSTCDQIDGDQNGIEWWRCRWSFWRLSLLSQSSHSERFPWGNGT